MEHGDLVGRLRREAGQFGHVSRFAARDAADAVEAAQARIAALEAELAVTREFVAEAVVMLDNANSPTDDARYDYVQRAVVHLIKAAQP
jgi:hypothetical protein